MPSSTTATGPRIPLPTPTSLTSTAALGTPISLSITTTQKVHLSCNIIHYTIVFTHNIHSDYSSFFVIYCNHSYPHEHSLPPFYCHLSVPYNLFPTNTHSTYCNFREYNSKQYPPLNVSLHFHIRSLLCVCVCVCVFSCWQVAKAYSTSDLGKLFIFMKCFVHVYISKR